MPAHPEHITASHALHRVSSFIQILHIARQCGGIAADIDYPLWLHPDDRVEADAVTAFARRIDDNDIGIDLIFSYSLGSTSSAFPTKTPTFSMPFNAAFRRASSIAGGTISHRTLSSLSAPETGKWFRFRSTDPIQSPHRSVPRIPAPFHRVFPSAPD